MPSGDLGNRGLLDGNLLARDVRSISPIAQSPKQSRIRASLMTKRICAIASFSR
jgi:hypothetical protein